mgnify:CR=1 FL=1
MWRPPCSLQRLNTENTRAILTNSFGDTVLEILPLRAIGLYVEREASTLQERAKAKTGGIYLFWGGMLAPNDCGSLHPPIVGLMRDSAGQEEVRTFLW